VEVRDQVIAEGVLCFHALHCDRTSGNGKRLTIGNSNRRRRTDSRGSNAQVWIRAPASPIAMKPLYHSESPRQATCNS
jgi:hypothetical protein